MQETNQDQASKAYRVLDFDNYLEWKIQNALHDRDHALRIIKQDEPDLVKELKKIKVETSFTDSNTSQKEIRKKTEFPLG